MSTPNQHPLPPSPDGGADPGADTRTAAPAGDGQTAPQTPPAQAPQDSPGRPDSSAPVGPQPAYPGHPGHPGPPAAPGRPGQQAQGPGPKRLSSFLKISIILLAALSIASISLLFIGDFEGKFERVFATFFLFAVFVLLTAFDTRREVRSEWYAPVALIANAYILGLLLIVIWMNPYDPFWLVGSIFWKSVLVIVVTRAVILCCQLLIGSSGRFPPVVGRFAFVTSVLAVLSGILFTAPVGIDLFDVDIPELYWKIATATLILVALGIAITLLLRWSYGAQAREAARSQRQAARAAQQAHQVHQVQAVQAPQQHSQQAYPPQGAPAQQELLPWPTFADGTPLPVGPDGQPDFSVLQQGPDQQR
ncbi:hypothetical protein JD276_01920 [Leucobacter sp. CSA1]|uniref:Uncharacterized protein n=1 Tax=Leucobacter chromiisoli TaxID=2796471 RepID=A0A934Q6L3_9MICO|nr:hypothetical protein [Leucobacter chromiisoli]MBK0417792.1 hypothetical protein [Leucobacter chromiisoli]